MRTFFRRYARYSIVIFLCVVSASLFWTGASFLQPRGAEAKIIYGTANPAEDSAALDEHHPRIRAVMEVRDRHHHALMALPDVVGTGVGLTEDQKPAIVVFTRRALGVGIIPDRLDSTPIVAKTTGDIVAMPAGGNASQKAVVNPAGWFPRPVPIGVSTGNTGECSAGTISARVIDSNGVVYALSNNHVYALENKAPIGSPVVQPGLYDTRCKVNSANVIGTLSGFVQISFTRGTTNTVDAAIAQSDIARLGNATPAGGYGKPGSTTVAASIGQAVQKYGRTTRLTTGTIQAINVTINVGYSSGTATFVNQILVRSPRAFIQAGDSGSLLVTNNAAANPVGLLFAGNGSGTYAFANPIKAVLDSFGVTIDGK